MWSWRLLIVSILIFVIPKLVFVNSSHMRFDLAFVWTSLKNINKNKAKILNIFSQRDKNFLLERKVKRATEYYSLLNRSWLNIGSLKKKNTFIPFNRITQFALPQPDHTQLSKYKIYVNIISHFQATNILTISTVFAVLVARSPAKADHCSDKMRTLIMDSCKAISLAHRQQLSPWSTTETPIVKRENEVEPEVNMEFISDESECYFWIAFQMKEYQ